AIAAGGTFGTWDAFKAELDATFTDRTARQHACEQLEHFYQGKLTIDDFYAWFETLLLEAQLTDDDERVRLVKRHVNRQVIDAIYATDNIPADYAAWKARTTSLGRNLQRCQEQVAHQQAHSTPHRVPGLVTLPLGH